VETSLQHLLLSDRELTLHGKTDLASRARALLLQQRETWPLLRSGIEGLAEVRRRTMELDGFLLRVEWNPARITSSSANVDPESIRRRACFLCPANLPPEQRGILFARSYLVLCNPFPIFREHFTIAHTSHTPQRLGPSFGDMLDLARAMQNRYTLMYNGPACGASAPDHLHYQAGEKGFLPLENEIGRLLERGEVLSGAGPARVTAAEAGLRRFIAITSSERDPAIGSFRAVESALSAVTGEKDEPMMNVLTWFEGGAWTVLVFPRARHRPSVYFAKGDERMLISPAVVDCGGVLITPLEKDFRRLTRDLVQEVFGEIFISVETFRNFCGSLAGSVRSR
jgi:hypothetical protein